VTIELYPIPFIDDIDIPDSVIKACKTAYETLGKEKAYTVMNEMLNRKEPSQLLRSLYLYRKAMLLTKKAHILGEGYFEKEMVAEPNNQYNIIKDPIWKRTKWSFLDKDASILLGSQNTSGLKTQSQFKLDDYAADFSYQNAYDDSTSLNLKKRGGACGMRMKRFDFEYKYSKSEYYRNSYNTYIYNTFKRVLFLMCKHDIYNLITFEDTEAFYTILGSLSNETKLSILNNVRNFILFEQEDNVLKKELSAYYQEITKKMDGVFKITKDELGRYEVDTEHNVVLTIPERADEIRKLGETKENYQNETVSTAFIDFLSDLHDTLLLPFEFVSYLICAMINPRYEAIIEDSKGNIGTYIFGGCDTILKGRKSSLGPSLTADDSVKESLSVLVPNITLLHQYDISLYENLFITVQDNYNIHCFSYNHNTYLTDIPLVHKEEIPFLNQNKERKLILFQYETDDAGHVILWLIYSDYIISYDCTNHIWITEDDGDPIHIHAFQVSSLFPTESKCVFASYDANKKTLIFLDDKGNIGSYNVVDSAPSRYNEKSMETNIHFNMAQNTPGDIIKIKKFMVIPPYNDKDVYAEALLVYNNETCQILEYTSTNGLKKLFEFDYYEGRPIADVVRLNDTRKIYIIYEDHKIIELSTYIYKPYVFQKSQDNPVTVKLANKSYFNLNETPLYITSDNESHIIHPLYETTDRISTLKIPVKKYATDGSHIARYNEYFIQESSISLFSNSYYALTSYLNSLQQPLNRRT
jgi:hypothetical protein